MSPHTDLVAVVAHIPENLDHAAFGPTHPGPELVEPVRFTVDGTLRRPTTLRLGNVAQENKEHVSREKMSKPDDGKGFSAR